MNIKTFYTDIHLCLRIQSPPNQQADYNDSCWASVRCTFILSSFVLLSPTAEKGGEVVEGPLTSATETSVTLITMELRGCANGMRGSLKNSANIQLVYCKEFEASPEEAIFLSFWRAKLCSYLHMWLICALVPSAVFGRSLVFSVMLSMMAKNQAARISNRRLYWHCASALLEIMSGVVIFKYCLQGFLFYPENLHSPAQTSNSPVWVRSSVKCVAWPLNCEFFLIWM